MDRPVPRTAQSNRTDLQIPATQSGPGQPNGQPVRVPTNLPYGEAGQLQQAQQAAPLAQTPTQAPPPVSAQDAINASKNFQMPDLGLMQPSARPNEPVTAGLPGSPVTASGPPTATGQVSALLTKLAAATGSGALSSLAQRAQGAGQ